MKKIIAVLLLFPPCFLLAMCSSAESGTEGTQVLTGISVRLTGEGKAAFANQAIQEYENSEQTDLAYDTEEIDVLMMDAALAQEDADRDFSLKELEKFGVYQYPAEPLAESGPLSGTGDITVDQVEVYYSVPEDVWIVSSSGRWLTDHWRSEQKFGDEIGGPDGFGVGFTEEKDYQAYVVRCVGVLGNGLDGDAQRGRVTYHRSDGDGAASFGFRLQDRIEAVAEISGQAPRTKTYLGQEWFSSCTYSSEFSGYEGVATGYYIHTWDQAVISSLNFGTSGKPAGIDVVIESGAPAFPVWELIQEAKIPVFVLLILGVLIIGRLVLRRR